MKQMWIEKRQLKTTCLLALDFMGLYDLVPYKVTFNNPAGGSFDSITLIEKEEFNDLFWVLLIPLQSKTSNLTILIFFCI